MEAERGREVSGRRRALFAGRIVAMAACEEGRPSRPQVFADEARERAEDSEGRFRVPQQRLQRLIEKLDFLTRESIAACEGAHSVELDKVSPWISKELRSDVCFSLPRRDGDGNSSSSSLLHSERRRLRLCGGRVSLVVGNSRLGEKSAVDGASERETRRPASGDGSRDGASLPRFLAHVCRAVDRLLREVLNPHQAEGASEAPAVKTLALRARLAKQSFLLVRRHVAEQRGADFFAR